MATRKLVSPQGDVLGTITYPDDIEARLQHFGGRLPISTLPRMALTFEPHDPTESMIMSWEIVEAYGMGMRGAVMVRGISLEEFEKLPGFSFAAGAGYLRYALGRGTTP